MNVAEQLVLAMRVAARDNDFLRSGPSVLFCTFRAFCMAWLLRAGILVSVMGRASPQRALVHRYRHAIDLPRSARWWVLIAFRIGPRGSPANLFFCSDGRVALGGAGRPQRHQARSRPCNLQPSCTTNNCLLSH